MAGERRPCFFCAKRIVSRVVCLSFIVPLFVSVPATAQESSSLDAPDPTQSDETSEARLTRRLLRVGSDDLYFRIYGQLDKALLLYDDGLSTVGYFPVDNDASSSRIGVRFVDGRDEFVTFGGTVEIGWTPYSTSSVSRIDNDHRAGDDYLLRKAEVHFDSSRFGKIWVGQGSMATDGASEVDLSGTSVAGYASVGDIAGGQLFRFADGSLSTITVGSAFSDLDGLGRLTRIRYDTPDWNGFGFSVSAGRRMFPEPTSQRGWDIALDYDNRIGNSRIAGKLGFSQSDSNGMRLDASVSWLNTSNGINLTVAGGIQEDESRFLYAKLGHRHDWFAIGDTAISIDGYLGNDLVSAGSQSLSVGFQAVQNFRAGDSQIYFGARYYEYDGSNADYKNGIAIISGVRYVF